MKEFDAEQFWTRYDQFAVKDFPLALKTGIKQSTLSTWKSRKIFPRADDAYKIASALITTVEFMVTGQQQNNDAVSSFLREIRTMVSPFSKEELGELTQFIRYIIQLHREQGSKNMADVIDFCAVGKTE